MAGVLLLMMVAGSTFAPLHAYEGTWTITSPHTMAGEGKTDTLENHCTEGVSFYACEQVVNGKSMALVVFTATADAGKFHSHVVLPDGRGVGRGDLTIAGDHWTFLSSSTDDNGRKTSYRTENYFKGSDRIHFEQYESGDEKTWVLKNQGDDVRGAR